MFLFLLVFFFYIFFVRVYIKQTKFINYFFLFLVFLNQTHPPHKHKY
ncbi:hypothetical protein CCP3SC1AL1_3220001 [Gammaproteobacteria bacterium]